MDLPAFEWLWNVVGPLCFNASPRILDSLVRLSGTLSRIGSGVDAACGRTCTGHKEALDIFTGPICGVNHKIFRLSIFLILLRNPIGLPEWESGAISAASRLDSTPRILGLVVCLFTSLKNNFTCPNLLIRRLVIRETKYCLVAILLNEHLYTEHGMWGNCSRHSMQCQFTQESRRW